MVYTCYDCGREWHVEQSLLQHCQALNHRDEWPCDECDGVFPGERAYDQHYEAVHEADEYYCLACSRLFCDEMALNQHNRAVHTSQNQQLVVRPSVPVPQIQIQHHQIEQPMQQSFRCNLCQFTCLTFNLQETSQIHESTYHSYNCEVCGQIFRTTVELQQHKQARHNFRCLNCHNTIFQTEQLLQEHISNYHSWKCMVESCGQEFTTSQRLQQHKQDTHTVPCLVGSCGEMFTTENELQRHTAAKHIYPCKICGNRTFETLQLFQRHNFECHSWRCAPCQMSLGTLAELQVHDAVKHCIYCHICDKSFLTASYNHHLSSSDHQSRSEARDVAQTSSSIAQPVLNVGSGASVPSSGSQRP